VDYCYENTGGRRDPVTVLVHPTYVEVIGVRPPTVLEALGRHPRQGCTAKRYRLCDTGKILGDASGILMQPWVPNLQNEDLVSSSAYEKGRYQRMACSKGARRWAEGQCRKSIATRVKAQLAGLFSTVSVSADVMAVHRASFAAGYNYVPNSLIFEPELYKHKYVVQDLVKFRAAAALLSLRDEHLHTPSQLVDWRTFYCPPGVRPYGHLNRTLTHVPGGVPGGLLIRLCEFILPRTITSRLELITTLLAAHHGLRNFRVLSQANSGQIAEAIGCINHAWQADWAQRHPTLPWTHYGTRRTAHIWKALQYMGDFPEDYHGDIVGLARRSIRWHQYGQEQERRKALATLGAQRSVATPPVAPPDIPGVRFLATVGEICQDGASMRHCVASYAEKAVNGFCFLFHVDHNGQSATVEVGPGGAVVQAKGPGNHENEASTWGRQVLTQWGKQFPQNQLE
jgi:hypothetical protein